MKLNEQILESKASEAVSNCFSDVPFCTLKWTKRNVRVGTEEVDAIGKLKIEGEEERTILMEAKRDGQPRNLRMAAYSLKRLSDSFKSPYPIVVAPYISDASANILAEEQVGYADLSGNCRISVGKIYIRKEGQSNRFMEKRDLRSLYSPKGERVLRVLLEKPRRSWLLKPLAEAADVSLGQASNIKKLLDGREWLKTNDAGFFLGEPELLLQEWSRSYKFARNRVSEFYSMASVDEIERAIAGENEGPSLGVLTAFSSAARYAPAVRYQKVSAYVRGEGSEAVASKLGWKGVASGGNVSLIEPYDEGVFVGGKTVESVEIVSPVQTYLDLRENPGRGEEAAEAIFREALRSKW